MKKINIFLTGGSGFIGKNFIEQRKKKYNIIAPSHKNLDLINTEKVNKFFQKNKIDVVLHCANIGGLRSDLNLKKIFFENRKIFSNLVNNRMNFGKMINLGSGAEYDKSKDIKSVKETDFGRSIPKDYYGRYKYYCSKDIEKTKNIYNLRLFGVFGKYEDYKVKFISNIICKYILNQPLTMIQDAYFDYIDVIDFIRILDYFITSTPLYKFYNIGTGKKISLLSIVRNINQLNNYKLPIKIQKNGFNKEYTCCNNRLIKELPEFKFTKIEDSIKKLYDYYLYNLNSFNKAKVLEDKYNKL